MNTLIFMFDNVNYQIRRNCILRIIQNVNEPFYYISLFSQSDLTTRLPLIQDAYGEYMKLFMFNLANFLKYHFDINVIIQFPNLENYVSNNHILLRVIGLNEYEKILNLNSYITSDATEFANVERLGSPIGLPIETIESEILPVSNIRNSPTESEIYQMQRELLTNPVNIFNIPIPPNVNNTNLLIPQVVQVPQIQNLQFQGSTPLDSNGFSINPRNNQISPYLSFPNLY